MNVEIKLFKRTGTYEKDGKDKQFTNYYLGLNDQLIPIEVKYFPNDKFGGRDPGYQGRVAALNLVAELLPEVPAKEKPVKPNPENITCPKCGKVMRIDDKDGDNYYLTCDACQMRGFIKDTGEVTFTEPEAMNLPGLEVSLT